MWWLRIVLYGCLYRCIMGTKSFTGHATTYGLIDPIGGSCSIRKAPFGVDPSLFVAMNGDQYDHSSTCSRCLSIHGPKGTIITYVADICFECGHGNLDFNTALWNTLIGGAPRIESIEWTFTPCPDEQEKFCKKEGSNPQWYALQVVNSRDGIRQMKINRQTANVIGITSFYQISASNPIDMNAVHVEIVSTTGMRSSFTLNDKSYQGCAMPSDSGPRQSVIDLTGRTKSLYAWRRYRQWHAKIY